MVASQWRHRPEHASDSDRVSCWQCWVAEAEKASDSKDTRRVSATVQSLCNPHYLQLSKLNFRVGLSLQSESPTFSRLTDTIDAGGDAGAGIRHVGHW